MVALFAGCTGPEPARAPRQPASAVLLGDSLFARWTKDPSWDALSSCGAVNRAVAGDSTEKLRARVADGLLDDIAPQRVVILVGTNDLNSKSPARTVEEIQVVLEEIRERVPEAERFVVGILPRGTVRDPLRASAQAVNEALMAFVDVIYITPPEGLDPALFPRAFWNDRLHMNADGYRILAQAVRPIVCHAL